MTKKIPGYIFGVFILFLAIYTGYEHHDIFIYGVELFGVFVYLCSAVAVYYSSTAMINSFFIIAAFSFIPVAILNLMYLSSFAGIDLWLAARFLEMLSLICALILIRKKVNKKAIFSAYMFFGIISAAAVIFLKIFPDFKDMEIWKKTTGTWSFATLLVIFIVFFLLLKNKRKLFEKSSYLYLLLFIAFKIPGDLMYIFFRGSEGFPAAAVYILRVASYFMLLRAVLKDVLIYPSLKTDKEFSEFKGYHRKLFKSMKIGVAVLSFSEDRSSVNFEDINDYAAKYSGIDKDEYLMKWIPADSLEPILAETVRFAAKNLKQESGSGEVRKVKIDQKDRYIKVQSHPYPGESVLVMFEDISHEVQREEKIKFLVLHDNLTKLFNRNYIAEVVKMLCDNTIYPVAVIIGDVNGLKATNDIFGHSEGDRLLCEITSIIKNSVGSDDVCIRYGGDEFLIISPNCDRKRTEDIIAMIRDRLDRSNVLDFTPNVSFGYSIMHEKEDLNGHIDAADRMMYVKKNEDEMNIRKGILKSLLKTLRFKNIESEEHLISVSKISMMIGESMDLSREELEELNLISTLHDIGKINIAVDILKKQGALNEEEWEKVKKHSMDGYSMTESIKEFKGVSKYILFHHEQWDGKGYPHGLKGDSIPLLSRIVSIADAYDSMTRERAYKIKFSKENAIREIVRNKARQFDPEIVDMLIKISDKI